MNKLNKKEKILIILWIIDIVLILLSRLKFMHFPGQVMPLLLVLFPIIIIVISLIFYEKEDKVNKKMMVPIIFLSGINFFAMIHLIITNEDFITPFIVVFLVTIGLYLMASSVFYNKEYKYKYHVIYYIALIGINLINTLLNLSF